MNGYGKVFLEDRASTNILIQVNAPRPPRDGGNSGNYGCHGGNGNETAGNWGAEESTDTAPLPTNSAVWEGGNDGDDAGGSWADDANDDAAARGPALTVDADGW